MIALTGESFLQGLYGTFLLCYTAYYNQLIPLSCGDQKNCFLLIYCTLMAMLRLQCLSRRTPKLREEWTFCSTTLLKPSIQVSVHSVLETFTEIVKESRPCSVLHSLQLLSVSVYIICTVIILFQHSTFPKHKKKVFFRSAFSCKTCLLKLLAPPLLI